MAGTVAQPNTRRIKPEQLAWGVMLLSFAVFCVIVIFLILSIQYFLFHSPVPMQSTLDVARGTATVIGSDLIEQAVHGKRDVSDGGVITTDVQSQATISFTDPRQSDRLVAAITVKNGSSLNLRQVSRPRFDWSNDPYWIDFSDAYGEFDVFVPDNLGRPILISLDTTLGPSARLTASGRYTVVAAGAQVQVMDYSGEAVLMGEDSNQPLSGGQSASVAPDTDPFSLTPTLVNLLGDTTFSANNVLDYNATADQVRSFVWRCNSVQPQGEPAGTFDLAVEDGRPALHFFRDEGAELHGATLCVQGLGSGTNGLDVSTYHHLSIRAAFKVESQSLSACGIDGSECPLMLRMDYKASDGSVVTWYHGFYAFVDPLRSFPLICNSCSEQHEPINPGVWYTYESPNLFESFAPGRIPTSILNLQFYASGHQYDVYVREVALLVDQGS